MPSFDPSLPEENRLCLKCGYSLEELKSNRCPECSRPFNLDDPRTFRYNERKWIPWVRIMGLYFPIVVAMGSYAYLFFIMVPQMRTGGTSVGNSTGLMMMILIINPILIIASIIVGVMLGFLFDWIQKRKHYL